jgi:hypothetical protein
MSIHVLIAIAVLALILVLAGPILRVLRYIAEVHEAKQRRRHAVRRRAQRKGYVWTGSSRNVSTNWPVFDDEWNPMSNKEPS